MQLTAILAILSGLAVLSSAFPAAASSLPVCGAGKTAVCADNQECHKIYCSPRPGSRVCKCVPQGQEPEDPFVAWGLPRLPHHLPEGHEEGPSPDHAPKPHGPPKSYGKPKPYDEPEREPNDCYLIDEAMRGPRCDSVKPKPYDVPKPHHVPKPSSTPRPFESPKYHNTTKSMPKPHHDPKPTWIPENPMIGGPHQRVPPPHSFLPYDKPEPHHLPDHPKPHPGPEPKEYSHEEICAAFCSLGVKMPDCDCPAPKPQYPKSHHEPKAKPSTYNEESPDAGNFIMEGICWAFCNSDKIPEGFDNDQLNSASFRCGCPAARKGGEIYPLPHYPGEDGGKRKNDHYFD